MMDVASRIPRIGAMGFWRRTLRRPVCRWLALAVIVPVLVAGIIIARFEPDELSLFHRALAACDEGRFTESTAFADKLAKAHGGYQFAIVIRGAVLLRTGRWTDALRQFSSVRPEGNIREPLLRLTGECLYRLGRLHEAARVMHEVADEYTTDSDSHRWLGAIFHGLGLKAQAIEQLEIAAQLAPSDADPHRLLGSIYYDWQQYGESVKHLQQALKLAPSGEQSTTVAQLAHCLLELRQYESVIPLLNEVTGQPDLIALRAEALWCLGRRSECVQDLNTVLRISPLNRRANLLQARLDTLDGLSAAGIKRLTRLVEYEPYDTSVRYDLAQALRDAGDEDNAQIQFQKLEECRTIHERYVELASQAAARPYDAELRGELGRICRSIGKLEAALAWERAANSCYQATANAGASIGRE